MRWCSGSQDLLSQTEIVEPHGGSIVQDVLKSEPSRVVWIVDASQVSLDGSAALVKGVRPRVE